MDVIKTESHLEFDGGSYSCVMTNYHATGTYLSKAECLKGAKEWRQKV